MSKAGCPSILNPASNEIISESVELWDTDVCFLHIQLLGTNVRLPNIHKILPPPRFILHPQGPQQNQNLGINPIDNAEPRYPHYNIASKKMFGFTDGSRNFRKRNGETQRERERQEEGTNLRSVRSATTLAPPQGQGRGPLDHPCPSLTVEPRRHACSYFSETSEPHASLP